jgi:hypothetical protein
MYYNLKVDFETISGLVKASLMDDYRSIEADVIALKQRKETLENYELSDLEYNKELLKSLEVVINYYTTADERPVYYREAELPRLNDQNWG